MSDLRNLAQALTDAGQAMRAPGPQGGLEGTLEVLAHAAREAVPGFEQMSVTVVRGDGTVTTVAATDGWARDMDNLQYEFDQGPCLDAVRREALVLVEAFPTQGHNWPMYAPRASKAGVRAQMGVRINDSQETLGSLNFYSTGSDMIEPGAARRAELFAAHAATALAHARRADNLGSVIPARELVGQAVGVLMERFEISEDRAMYYLVRVATVAELPLRDVAHEVVQEVSGRAS
jgi:GAF domain-containing protein